MMGVRKGQTTKRNERKKNMKTLTNITYLAFALFAFACFALSPTVQAQLPPPAPDGGYPNDNTAEGDNALFNLTTGGENTATGAFALYNNTTGNFNTATGGAALYDNTTGSSNTATGFQALASNNGDGNTANGFNALFGNISGDFNTANGYEALFSNTAGIENTATGCEALQNNTTGVGNTATGFGALESNTNGTGNIAVGYLAGANLTTGSNNIDVGAPGVGAEANTIRIGASGTQRKTFIAGISKAIVPGGVGVIVGTTGQLGTVVSSARFKEAIKPMDKASEAILALKPVTFRYKKELDLDKIPQFGLIAEEVEKVNPGLIARDEEGKIMSVRYEAVNAMLLNEFLKEHQKVERQDRRLQEQEKTIAQLKTDLQTTGAQQQKQIDALTAGLQKVSAQLEISKPEPQTVLNNR
jgi:hypothetical protein